MRTYSTGVDTASLAADLLAVEQGQHSQQTVTETTLVAGVDSSQGEDVICTLTANRVMGLPQNGIAGRRLQLVLTQGGAGGFTLTAGTGVVFSNFALNTTAGAVTTGTLTCLSPTSWVLALNPPPVSVTTPAAATGGAVVYDKGGEAWHLKDFGGVADGATHPLSGYFGTLAAAQAVYPAAIALTQEVDGMALQLAINSVALGAGVPGISLVAGPGTWRLDTTIQYTRRAIMLRGSGGGNPVDYAPNPGKATVFHWVGAAGQPMFHIEDTRNPVFEDFHMQGNNTNIPSEGMFFEYQAGDTYGTNAIISVTRVTYGFASWLGDGGSYKMNYCVRFGGANGNNQQWYFNKCGFRRAVITGFQVDQTQSVWGSQSDCEYDGNSTANGLVTSASTVLFNPQFGQNLIDITVNSTAQVTAFGYMSENALQLVQVNAASGRFVAVGGNIHLGAIVGGYFIRHEHCSGTGCVDIQGINLLSIGANQIRIRCDTGTAGTLRVVNCNLPTTAYDVIAPTGGVAGLQITVEDAGIYEHPFLNNGETWVPVANGGWQSYTPTLGGGWAVGNGTMVAKYQKIGKTVHFSIIVTWGSTSTFTASPLTFTVPFTIAGGQFRLIPSAGGLHNAAANYIFGAVPNSSTSFAPQIIGASGILAATYITSTTPWTWAAADQIYASGTYEAA